MTKETGCNNRVKLAYLALKYQQFNNITDNDTTKQTSHNDRKILQRTKNEWKSTKAKRIAQVSFQAKIDASHVSTTARSKAREIQNTAIDASLSL